MTLIALVGLILILAGAVRDRCTPVAAFLCGLSIWIGIVLLFIALLGAWAGPLGRIH